MKVRVSNYANSNKVKEVFKEHGWNENGFIIELTEGELLDLSQEFAFTHKLDVMINPKNNIVLFLIDSSGFSHRSNNRNSKKRLERSEISRKQIMAKEHGTKRYPIEEVLPHIKKRYGIKPQRKDFDGDLIKINSLRLRTFQEKGCKCITCGLEGTFFLKVRNSDEESWHFNLYGEKDGEIVLFTKDHILPKSKGGKDCIENMQTMCRICNEKKGNKIIPIKV